MRPSRNANASSREPQGKPSVAEKPQSTGNVLSGPRVGPILVAAAGGFCDHDVSMGWLKRRGTALASRFDNQLYRSANDWQMLNVIPPHEAELAVRTERGRLPHSQTPSSALFDGACLSIAEGRLERSGGDYQQATMKGSPAMPRMAVLSSKSMISTPSPKRHTKTKLCGTLTGLPQVETKVFSLEPITPWRLGQSPAKPSRIG